MDYNYYEAVADDVRNYIENEVNLKDFEKAENWLDLEELSNYLNDELFIEDSVTGNASGSYTFNSYEAREYVIDNMNLAREAGYEYGDFERIADYILNEEWETIDVIIRCYVLFNAISEIMDEVADEWEARGEDYIAG